MLEHSRGVDDLRKQIDMTQTTRACADCRMDISDRHGNARRCEPCSKARLPVPCHNVKNPAPPRSVTCAVCGDAFTTQSHRKITCSTACRMWARHHPGKPRPQGARCAFCGKPVDKRASTTYCSKRCRGAASKRRVGRTSVEFIVHSECVHCGTPLGESRAGKKYCSATCEIREYGHPGSYSRRASRCCEYCGTPLDPNERINRRHCSDQCTVKANQVM